MALALNYQDTTKPRDAPTGAGREGDGGREGASGHAVEREQYGVGVRLLGQVLSKGGMEERLSGARRDPISLGMQGSCNQGYR
jgi:hypothetical protein